MCLIINFDNDQFKNPDITFKSKINELLNIEINYINYPNTYDCIIFWNYPNLSKMSEYIIGSNINNKYLFNTNYVYNSTGKYKIHVELYDKNKNYLTHQLINVEII